MSAFIPVSILTKPLEGLPLVQRGKVRDAYRLSGGRYLIVATDRVSIFDFVLPACVERKGEVLNALNIFWRLTIFGTLLGDASPFGYGSDLLAWGANIDRFLPRRLRCNSHLWRQSVVVQKLQMVPVEAVVRGYLTGSGFAAYQETAPKHTVCGHELPQGLHDGAKLPWPLFTPTTKAKVGHDTHISVSAVRAKYGVEIENLSLLLFTIGSRFALSKGVIIADTKFEWGYDRDGRLSLGDEIFTPDSSRFWDSDEWRAAKRKEESPPAWDKQFVRDWGKTEGVHTRKPEKTEDVAFVSNLKVPTAVCEKTTDIYLAIFERLTGRTLDEFQTHFLCLPC